MDTQDDWRQLQFALDDLLWDSRKCHYTLQQTCAYFDQLSERYLSCMEAEELPKVRLLLDDFQAKIDSGAVTTFVEKVA
ncbi:MAG: hypothetical protein V7731_23090 [Amphritea sp.]